MIKLDTVWGFAVIAVVVGTALWLDHQYDPASMQIRGPLSELGQALRLTARYFATASWKDWLSGLVNTLYFACEVVIVFLKLAIWTPIAVVYVIVSSCIQ